MVLIFGSNTGNLGDNIDSRLAQDLRVAHARAFQHKGGAQGAGGEDDELLGTDPLHRPLDTIVELRVGPEFDTRGLVAVKEHTDDLVLGEDVEVGVEAVTEARVQVVGGGVLALASVHVADVTLRGVDGFQVLDVAGLRVAELSGRLDEALLGRLCRIVAWGHEHGPRVTVCFGRALTFISLELPSELASAQLLTTNLDSGQGITYPLKIRNQILGKPPLDSPLVVVNGLSTAVGEQVDGRAAAEDTAGWHDKRAIAHGLLGDALIEKRVGVSG